MTWNVLVHEANINYVIGMKVFTNMFHEFEYSLTI
jgi:hypothetical protein